MIEPFTGAKVALICADTLLVYRRDASPNIPWPGCWDLPGGGREGDECPAGCALRELEEEFALAFEPARLFWGRQYPPRQPGALPGWFFVARLLDEEIAAIRFGDEGQYWQMMSISEFLAQPDAVPYLQERLTDYLSAA